MICVNLRAEAAGLRSSRLSVAVYRRATDSNHAVQHVLSYTSFFEPVDVFITSYSSTLIISTILFGAWRDCKHRYPLHWYGVWIYHLYLPLDKYKSVWHRYMHACSGSKDLIARKVSATASALRRQQGGLVLQTRLAYLVYKVAAEVDVEQLP